MRIGLVLLVVVVAATACTVEAEPAPTTSAAEVPGTVAGSDTTASTTSTSSVEAPEPAPSTVPVVELPVTPSQQEGPYYPVSELDDQDNDLTSVSGVSGVPSGNPLLLRGTLLMSDGSPVEGGVVEIWQVDSNGIYLHPDDPKTEARDPFFQFSGEATVDEDGVWGFRTIDPGYYEPRPRHIHVKVLVGDEAVLTTQIYFSDDPQAAGIDPLLVASVEPGTDDDGSPLLVAEHRIVLTDQ